MPYANIPRSLRRASDGFVCTRFDLHELYKSLLGKNPALASDRAEVRRLVAEFLQTKDNVLCTANSRVPDKDFFLADVDQEMIRIIEDAVGHVTSKTCTKDPDTTSNPPKTGPSLPTGERGNSNIVGDEIKGYNETISKLGKWSRHYNCMWDRARIEEHYGLVWT